MKEIVLFLLFMGLAVAIYGFTIKLLSRHRSEDTDAIKNAPRPISPPKIPYL